MEVQKDMVVEYLHNHETAWGILSVTPKQNCEEKSKWIGLHRHLKLLYINNKMKKKIQNGQYTRQIVNGLDIERAFEKKQWNRSGLRMWI